MSPNGSVSRKRLPCFRTWTLPRSVALWIGTIRASVIRTPPPSPDGAVRGGATTSAVSMPPASGESAAGVVRSDSSAAVAGASGRCGMFASGDLGQAIGLVGHDQGVDQSVDVAVHHPRQ